MANDHGWSFAKADTNTGMISFTRQRKRYRERINIYRTTMTVTTQLNHQKTGKNQLHRKNVSLSMLAEIFKNPRVHTGKGYRKKV